MIIFICYSFIITDFDPIFTIRFRQCFLLRQEFSDRVNNYDSWVKTRRQVTYWIQIVIRSPFPWGILLSVSKKPSCKPVILIGSFFVFCIVQKQNIYSQEFWLWIPCLFFLPLARIDLVYSSLHHLAMWSISATSK